jgi:hypothetical protein
MLLVNKKNILEMIKSKQIAMLLNSNFQSKARKTITNK